MKHQLFPLSPKLFILFYSSRSILLQHPSKLVSNSQNSKKELGCLSHSPDLQIWTCHTTSEHSAMDSLPGPPLSIFLISCLSSFLLKTSTPYLTHAYYPFLKDIRSLSLLLDSGTVFHTTFAIVIEKQYLNAHWKYMFEKRLFKNIKIDLLRNIKICYHYASAWFIFTSY